jgi:PAS domain S-box-containing protein
MELLARVRSLLKVKAYNDLISNYQKDLESEVTSRTEELKHALENLQQEMTEHKKTEEALQENQARLDLALRSAKLGVWRWDIIADKRYFDEQTCYLLGINPATFTGAAMEFIGAVHPDDRDSIKAAMARTIEQSVLYEPEYRTVWPDGSIHYISARGMLLRDDKGRPRKINGVVFDITDRKQAEEKLLESKTLIETVVENVPLMIFLKEATDLRFVIFNRAGEELLGYDRKDLLGKNNLDLFPPEQAAHFMAKDREVLDGKAGVMDIPEELIQTAKKGQRLLHTKKVCIRSDDGATKYLLGISEDITERKEAEQKLKDTLESLRKALGTTIQVMVSAVEVRDPYTAGHQIRSANLAHAIATEMGLPQNQIDGIRMAGSIHDIGKLSIPAEILSKPKKLTEGEFSLIKEHSRSGYEMLKDVESPWPLAEIVYQHHERMNGSGYPRNLKGDDILMEARILAVADVVEAMASHRPYRPGLGIDAALNEIEKNRGIFYDETAVDACLRLFREKDFQLEESSF